MNSEEIIKEKLEFLKLEYAQLKTHNDHLEKSEWNVRQLGITLWLASIGVGLGLQGVTTNNIYILMASAFVPYVFLYIDSRIFRWVCAHKARMKQIELFISSGEYVVPSTGKKTSFAEFCSSIEKTYGFPVLDFNGKATCGNDLDYIINTTATFPHMVTGLRRYIYQFQIWGALIMLSIQLYSIYKTPLVFSVIAMGPIVYFLLVAFARRREKNLRSETERRLKNKTN